MGPPRVVCHDGPMDETPRDRAHCYQHEMYEHRCVWCAAANEAVETPEERADRLGALDALDRQLTRDRVRGSR